MNWNRSTQGFTALTVALVAIISTILEFHGLVKLHLFRYDYAFFDYAFHVVLSGKNASLLYNAHQQWPFLHLHHFHFNPHNQYVYPPQFAVLFSPFGLLPFSLSYAAWAALTIASYGVAIALLVGMYWRRDIGIANVVIIAFLAMLLTPFQVDIGAGNINSILFALLVITFYLRHRNARTWIAGVPLGIAIVCKVTPAAVLVYFLLRKEWRTAISTGITTILLTILTGMTVGWSSLTAYAAHFVSFGHTSMQNGPAPYNQSLIGVLQLFVDERALRLSTSQIHLLFDLFVVIAIVVVVAISQQRVLSWPHHMAIAMLMPLLFSPLVEEMYMLFVIPALFAVMQYLVHVYRQRGRFTFASMVLTICGAFSLLSILMPVTFAINFATAAWPHLYWIQMRMFLVLILMFLTITWLNLRGWRVQLASTAKQPPRIPTFLSGNVHNR